MVLKSAHAFHVRFSWAHRCKVRKMQLLCSAEILMSLNTHRLHKSITAIPQSCIVSLQMVTDTLALLVAALALLPDRQPAIVSALLMLLIEVMSQQPFWLAMQTKKRHSAPHESLQCIRCIFLEFI